MSEDRDQTSGERELRISKIRDGTVIDHVAAGQALNVLSMLGIDGSEGLGVSIGMNVPSDRLGRKDVVKLEDRELSEEEVAVLSLLAPDATVNIIREFAVADKRAVERPDTITGVLACPNPECITNAGEPADATFDVIDDGVRCRYCATILRERFDEHLADR